MGLELVSPQRLSDVLTSPDPRRSRQMGLAAEIAGICAARRWTVSHQSGAAPFGSAPLVCPCDDRAYWTAFTMSKIGRYIATTMPPTMTPSTTIMIGSMRDSSALTATSTSAS
jgi:hypothetical protein